MRIPTHCVPISACSHNAQTVQKLALVRLFNHF
jgi:hypothetical protein